MLSLGAKFRAVLSIALLFAVLGAGFTTQSALAQDSSSMRAESLLADVLTIASESGKESAEAYAMSLSEEDLALLNEAFLSYINENMVIREEGDFSEAIASGILPPEAIFDEGNASASANMTAQACYGPFTRTRYAEASVWPHERFWTYTQQISVCGSGNWVTSANCNATVGNTGAGWSFQGHLQYCEVILGGIGWNQIKYQSQGSFCAGFGYCLQTAYPWIAQQVLASDGYYWSWAG